MRGYKEFRNVPIIDKLAPEPIWTVSDASKKPIDMFALKTFHMLRGAQTRDWLSLDTLDAVTELIPNAVNRACLMDSLDNGLVVLDIEPSCPAHVRARLMSFPALYAETSMSGKGVHLILPLQSDILDAYPAARRKLALRGENGWYEFLMDHFVTFTGNQIPRGSGSMDAYRSTFEDLARQQRASRSDGFLQGPDESKSMSFAKDPVLSRIADIVSRAPDYGKDPEDFKSMSEYEFGWLQDRYAKLLLLTYDPAITMGRKFSDEEFVWMLYAVAERCLPRREKHAKRMHGMPWLMYRAGKVYMSKKPRPPEECADDDPDGERPDAEDPEDFEED